MILAVGHSFNRRRCTKKALAAKSKTIMGRGFTQINTDFNTEIKESTSIRVYLRPKKIRQQRQKDQRTGLIFAHEAGRVIIRRSDERKNRGDTL
jgi:hypothetical protein